MKKEISIVIALALFIASSVIDYISGPVMLPITKPLAFLAPHTLSIYPLSAVSVFIRTLAMLITVVLLLSIIEKKYFTKVAITFVVGAVAILYAIQQLATGMRVTPILWTLSIAYAGMGLVLPIAAYILLGIVSFFKPKEQEMVERTEPEEVGKTEEHGDSVLEPPKE